MTASQKKNSSHFLFDFERTAYNKQLAQTRIKVENHFSHLKKWKALKNIYRGNLQTHKDIFWCCEILIDTLFVFFI